MCSLLALNLATDLSLQNKRMLARVLGTTAPGREVYWSLSIYYVAEQITIPPGLLSELKHFIDILIILD
jgi:hypothetical protein